MIVFKDLADEIQRGSLAEWHESRNVQEGYDKEEQLALFYMQKNEKECPTTTLMLEIILKNIIFTSFDGPKFFQRWPEQRRSGTRIFQSD